VEYSATVRVDNAFIFAYGNAASAVKDKDFNIFVTADSPEQVLSFYRNIAANNGLREVTGMNMLFISPKRMLASGYLMPDLTTEEREATREIPIFAYTLMDGRQDTVQDAYIRVLKTMSPSLPLDKLVVITQKIIWYSKLV
jgi:hypothetical protein